MQLTFKPAHLLSLTFVLSLFFISCEKENSANGTDAQQEEQASVVSSQSDAEAELVFNDVFDDAMGVNDEVGIEGVGTMNRINPCYSITITRLNAPALFPVKIVVDFGATGCTGIDGHVRKGKIITEYTGRLLVAGASATTRFDGYYVDSVKVEGVHKITNTSASANIRQFTVNVTDAKLTKPSGNYVQWHDVKVITQAEGLSTVLPIDDIFKVEGSAGGKAKNGDLLAAWESNITEPLVKKYACRWIVKGKVKTVRINTTTSSPWVAVLDFGNGNCDREATITINGVFRQITLR